MKLLNRPSIAFIDYISYRQLIDRRLIVDIPTGNVTKLCCGDIYAPFTFPVTMTKLWSPDYAAVTEQIRNFVSWEHAYKWCSVQSA